MDVGINFYGKIMNDCCCLKFSELVSKFSMAIYGFRKFYQKRKIWKRFLDQLFLKLSLNMR